MADKVWSSTSSTAADAAGNYAGGAPVTGDNLILNDIGTANIETVLPYYTNVLGLTLNATDAFTSNVGKEASGTNNASFFKVGTTGTSHVYVGRNEGGNDGNGSPLMLLDGNSGTFIVNAYKTGSKTGAYPCLCLKGTAVTLNAFGGETGFAIRPTDTGTLTALSLLKYTGFTPPVVRCGAGTTFPASIRVDAGSLYSHSTHAISSTLYVNGADSLAETQADSTGAIVNVDLTDGATFRHKGTGAVTAVTARASCVLDYSQDAQAKTLDEVWAYRDAVINLDNGNASSITHSAGGTNVPIIHCPDGVGTVKITAPAGMALSIQ